MHIIVLFEVFPTEQGMARYLELGAQMLALVQNMSGFIRAERFQSLKEQGKLLSLSEWESEEAVNTWRKHMEHALCQQEGRESLFHGYNITITKALRQYSHGNVNQR